jgi:di/tricarboxylate transporter
LDRARVQEFKTSRDFVLLSEPGDGNDFRRAPLALLFLLAALLPPLLGLAPLAISAVAGALLMVGTGCVAMRDAGRFVEWRVLFLVVGTLPLGEALELHGVADQAAHAVVAGAARFGATGVLAALFLLAALVSVTSSNAAAAVVLAPIARKAAEEIGIEPRNALLAVAYGCRCAFLVPFAHQCNLMVMGPGGYRTKDFLVVGGALSVVVAAVSVGMLTAL